MTCISSQLAWRRQGGPPPFSSFHLYCFIGTLSPSSRASHAHLLVSKLELQLNEEALGVGVGQAGPRTTLGLRVGMAALRDGAGPLSAGPLDYVPELVWSAPQIGRGVQRIALP